MDKIRCGWCVSDSEERCYHDQEWGIPVFDDNILFEFLVLESFQAGLSWRTILHKRPYFRDAFDQFNYHKIAQYQEADIEALLNNPQIIRHRAKIAATINNAQQFLKIQKQFGSFSNYIWAFTDGHIIDNHPQTAADIPAQTKLSQRIAHDLKQHGFKFLGPTTVYAYMQAIGIVNDHIVDCWVRQQTLLNASSTD